MPKTKTPALLTVTQATTQARRMVTKTTTAQTVTVESRLSHDLAMDVPIVITTITFPASDLTAEALHEAAADLSGYLRTVRDSSRLVIVRAR